MNIKILLERLKEDFTYVGDEKISGHSAIRIINKAVEDLTIPKEVEYAEKYINECHRDMGFLGSPEYEKQIKIYNSYYEPIRQKEKDKEEFENYLRLKSKYDGENIK